MSNKKLKELAKQYAEAEKQEKEAGKRRKDLKNKIVDLVGKSYKTSYISVTETAAKTTLVPDADKLKAAGIFEKYAKKQHRKGSIRVTVKPDKLNDVEMPGDVEVPADTKTHEEPARFDIDPGDADIF